MVIGSICAVAQGVALPVSFIFFGNMIDVFVDAGKSTST